MACGMGGDMGTGRRQGVSREVGRGQWRGMRTGVG